MGHGALNTSLTASATFYVSLSHRKSNRRLAALRQLSDILHSIVTSHRFGPHWRKLVHQQLIRQTITINYIIILFIIIIINHNIRIISSLSIDVLRYFIHLSKY